MTKIKQTLKNLWQDESAQGVSEYILLLVVVIAIAFLFRNQIIGLVRGKMDEVGTGMGQFSTNPDQ